MTLQFFNKIFNLGGTSTVPLDFGGFRLGVTTAVKKVLEFFGYPLNLTNIPTATTLAGYKVYGSTEQDGTPTPKNPIEVQSVGEKTNNLYNMANVQRLNYFYDDSGNKKTDNTSSILDYYVEVKPETSYMAALDVNKILRIAFFDENKVFIERASLITTVTKRIFTTPKNCRYILLQVYLNDSFPTKILVSEDTSLTIDNYEPYGYKVPIVINEQLDLATVNYTKGWLTNTAGVAYPSVNDSYKDAKYILLNVKAGDTIIITGNEDTNSRLRCLNTDGKSLGEVRPDQTALSEYYEFVSGGHLSYLTTSEIKIKKDFVLGILSVSGAVIKLIIDKKTSINIYLSEPLRKIGDYADYIDYENQQVVRNIVRHTVKSLSEGGYWAAAGNNRFNSTLKDSVNGSASHNPILSTGYNPKFSIDNGSCFLSGNRTLGACCIDTTYDTVESFVANRGDIEFYYALATPTTEKITLPNIAIPKGDSVITTDTEIKPSDMYGKAIV